MYLSYVLLIMRGCIVAISIGRIRNMAKKTQKARISMSLRMDPRMYR